MHRPHLLLPAVIALASCAATPEPRPARVDPSNAEAPEAEPIAPLEAFQSGPRSLDESLLPPEAPEEEAPGGHEGHGS